MVVLRDGARGLEVFCVVRHARSSFLGGALVFPGGKVDPQDAAQGWALQATEPGARAALFATDAVSSRTLAVAACRETLEEGAILPVDQPLHDRDVVGILQELQALGTTQAQESAAGKGAQLDRSGGAPVAPSEAGSQPSGAPLPSPPPLCAALARRGLRLALGELIPWARWITPEAESRRFDARFYLLSLPEGQIGRHDDRETTMSFWVAPREVLDRAARGEFFLAPPTLRTLELLAGAPDVRSAVTLAGRQSLLPICPRFVPGEAGGPPFIALPGDPAHEIPERRTDGPTRYVLREGRFVSEEPPSAPGSPQDDPFPPPGEA